jgi:hypothetical protein
MLRAFLAGVRRGENPQPDINVARRTLAVMLAAQESLRSGATITIRSITG